MSLPADLHQQDLRNLTDADTLTAFLERLGYTGDRLVQTPENLGIHAEATRRPVRHVERLARRGAPVSFEVYLFELSKVTLTHTRALVKPFRDRAGHFLLVLTSDWQRLDFVYVERQVPDFDDEPAGLRQIETVRVRPRILTLDRRQGDRVALRVLRRLRWDADNAIDQSKRVLEAYDLVEDPENADRRGIPPANATPLPQGPTHA